MHCEGSIPADKLDAADCTERKAVMWLRHLAANVKSQEIVSRNIISPLAPKVFGREIRERGSLH